jgi:antitoxin (DNA-binding transcriptional repressor) of toxin-antitoxin stability system
LSCQASSTLRRSPRAADRNIPASPRDAQLSNLIDAALAGEEVLIAKDGKPIVRLVANAQSPFKLGVLAGQLSGSIPDFFEPMSDEQFGAWEGA